MTRLDLPSLIREKTLIESRLAEAMKRIHAGADSVPGLHRLVRRSSELNEQITELQQTAGGQQ